MKKMVNGAVMDRQAKRWEFVLCIGAPFVLAVVELFHPHPPQNMLALDVQRWLFVHYAQILLFPLTGPIKFRHRNLQNSRLARWSRNLRWNRLSLRMVVVGEGTAAQIKGDVRTRDTLS